ncbi:MAG: hypothetical protein ACHQVK_01360, partial [Candidatus Paceibacterales bacterium]
MLDKVNIKLYLIRKARLSLVCYNGAMAYYSPSRRNRVSQRSLSLTEMIWLSRFLRFLVFGLIGLVVVFFIYFIWVSR